MLVDTHAHINDEQFAEDRSAVLDRMQAAGVTQMVEVAESPETWDAALALADQYPFIYASLGIHPHHAHEVRHDWPTIRQRLREKLAHPKAIAVGEFGLDYFRMQNTREDQLFILEEQLAIARDLDKPVVIHCRENEAALDTSTAHDDLQERLFRAFPEVSHDWKLARAAGVIHCFSGTWRHAQLYMAHGFMLGVDGPATYPSAKTLKDNVLRMPLERLVLETDSPYLPPQPFRGKRNEPAYLVHAAEAIAQLKHVTLEQLAQATTANAHALFRGME